MTQWVGAQGRPKVAKKSKNIPTYGSPPENPKPKKKNYFFRFRLEELLNP